MAMVAFSFASIFLLVATSSQSAAFSTSPHAVRARLDLCLSSTTSDDTLCATPMLSRREVIAAVATLVLTSSSPAYSASEPEEKNYVNGNVMLQKGLSLDETIGPNAALYVTARPNRADNVPRAILDGSRGKPPPVLSARFANPMFPFDFSLTSQNFTPEGASIVDGATSSDGDAWWAKEDLIVSARLDSDGVAATRDPTDLVGRGIYSASAATSVTVELQGRGLFGKSVTSKK